MITDGAHKRKGKFLKKDSPLMEKVKIQRFNFSEIRKSKVLYPDNPSYNIYYKKFQQPEHIDKTVALSGKIFEDLQGKGMKAPVIFPRDFTADWIEEKKKMKRRSAHKNFDDDEFEMAIEEEERKAREEENLVEEYRERISKKDHPSDSIKENEKISNQEIYQNKEESNPDSDPESNTEENLKSLQSGPAETTSMQDMGEAIRNFSHSGVESNPLKTIKDEGQPEDVSQGDFVPTPITEEQQAKRENESTYDMDQEQEKHNIFEQAHEKGYEEGLRKGKEEAIFAAQQETQSMIDSFHKSLTNLKDLNRKILEKAQDNFTEISSALSEALIGKAIKIDPSLFKNIIDKAIAEGIGDQDYRIRVSPKLLGELKKLGINDIDDRWQEDPSIEEGQFVVESDEMKISNNLRDIINTMVGNLDLNLFEEAPAENYKKQDEE
ncbi:MAG: FliH/SctL family protein [Oligoflexales bacterium]